VTTGGVILTGATGFLGGHLAANLRARGARVSAIGRNPAALKKLAETGCEVIPLDLGEGVCPPVPEGAEVMIHAAALSSPWGRHADFHRANVIGTRTALEMARRAGVRRFVHISTPSVYFRFEDQENVKENKVLPPPVNAYAQTKGVAERIVLEAGDLDPVVLRPRGIYGPGDTAILPRLLQAARKGPLPLVRDGSARTDLTHVEDVVAAVLAGMGTETRTLEEKGRIFNVSGGEPLRIRDIVEAACKAAGVPVRWRAVPVGALMAYASALETLGKILPGRPEPRITRYGAGLFAYTQTLNLDRARDGLGWLPRVGYAEGLCRLYPPFRHG
jgi:nucleoside-diphosphate-sugar epimerase